MGCSVNYIEKHYDSAIVEDMTDYITIGINEKSKDAFNDIVLRWWVVKEDFVTQT